MVVPSFSDFKQLATQGNLISIVEEIHFDWETPLSAFRKIDSGKFSFLLESVEGGEKWGRYSFLGFKPSYLFRSKGEEFEIIKNEEVIQKGKEKDPLQALEDFLRVFHPVLNDSLPRFFGGAVGYINYDVVRSFERIPEILSKDIDLYDCYFMVTDPLLVFDNVKQKVKVISNVFLNDKQSLKEAYQEARERIGRIVSQLQSPTFSFPEQKSFSSSPLRSNFSREDFIEAVERAKEYIKAGDVIQVVLSQRFSTEVHCQPFDIYRALRSINPSPYLFYLKMDDIVLLGASPEVMVRLEGRQIDLRPLAGTRPRGKTPEDDVRMERELLTDEKEKAEHIMLVSTYINKRTYF